MRKLKLQMNIALDNKWDRGMSEFSLTNLSNVDCILHGRKTGEGFIPYWVDVANNPGDSEHALGKRFSEIPNIIFSNTLKDTNWNNTTILGGDMPAEINALKSKAGKDIIVYGGDSFASSLLRHNLIDEVYLLVNPGAIGNGQQTFNPLAIGLELKLMACRPFDCGTVLLCYSGKK